MEILSDVDRYIYEIPNGVYTLQMQIYSTIFLFRLAPEITHSHKTLTHEHWRQTHGRRSQEEIFPICILCTVQKVNYKLHQVHTYSVTKT